VRALLRLPTPVGWTVLAVVVAIVAIAIGRGVGLRWDPFDLAGRRLRTAEARLGTAVADAAARRLEVEGTADQARRLDHSHQQAAAVARVTADAAARARSAPDETTPLDPARADRLLRHDRELCRLAPAVCDAPAADPATGGDQAVRAGPAA